MACTVLHKGSRATAIDLAKKISLLDVLMLQDNWTDVGDSTIRNCWRKGGLVMSPEEEPKTVDPPAKMSTQEFEQWIAIDGSTPVSEPVTDEAVIMEVAEPASSQAKDGSDTSLRSSRSTELGEGPSSNTAAALAKVELDDTLGIHLVGNPFFQRTHEAPPFDVPSSPAFLEELKYCWVDPRVSAHHGSGARILASMQNAEKHGLVHMPPVNQSIALLTLSLDEALKDKASCLGAVPGQLFRPEAEQTQAWGHWGRTMGPLAQHTRKHGAQNP
eukprot:superscaffoldBa00001235_g9655